MNDIIFITGGAGFIGSNFVLAAVNQWGMKVVNLDLLTYAGNIENLAPLKGNPNHTFIKLDINDKAMLEQLFLQHTPRAIINFAAESHVDRSISDPHQFIRTNIFGTYTLLEVAREYWNKLASNDKQTFRFLHVSTDEVYGSLSLEDPAFTEQSLYQPNSPYSASKASSDHLVRAWFHTYGLPTIITNCSNNYGPLQFPEKLIPLVITNALEGKLLPIYGDGKNIRDWLFVSDHCEAIQMILEKGSVGENYNIGGNNERTNLDIVQSICKLLDKLVPCETLNILHPETKKVLTSYVELITFVADRLGHDRRYAINSNKMQSKLGWIPKETLETGLAKTVDWYIKNSSWIRSIKTGEYRARQEML